MLTLAFTLPLLCRLVTPLTLQRKRRRESMKKKGLEKSKSEAADYHKLLVQRLKEQRERRCVWGGGAMRMAMGWGNALLHFRGDVDQCEARVEGVGWGWCPVKTGGMRGVVPWCVGCVATGRCCSMN